MSTFNEAEHPRHGDGRWATKELDEVDPGFGLDPIPESAPGAEASVRARAADQERLALLGEIAHLDVELADVNSELGMVEAEIAAVDNRTPYVEMSEAARRCHAATFVVDAAVRDVYVEHGVSPRMAGYLSGDSIVTAAGRNPFKTRLRDITNLNDVTELRFPRQVAKLKKKRGDTASAAAAAAARQDPRIVEANEQLAAAFDEWSAKRTAWEKSVSQVEPHRRRVSELNRVKRDLSRRRESLCDQLDTAVDDYERHVAAVDAGLSGPEVTVSPSSSRVEGLRRTADGALNASVWDRRGKRWTRIVDVRPGSGMGRSLELVDETGRGWSAHERRSPVRGVSRSSINVVVDTDVTGTPVGEGDSFVTFIDSGD